MPTDYSVPMVDNTMRILERMSVANRPVGIKELSTTARVPYSSAFRILFTLTKSGFIYRDPATGKYSLGPKMSMLAWKPSGTRQILEIVNPHLHWLHETHNETVNLAMLRNDDILYVAILESTRPFRMTAEIGSRVPIHATGIGKAFAAFLPPAQLNQLLNKCSWTKFTANTMVSRSKFLKSLEAVRKSGFSSDEEEAELGAACIAVPLLDSEGAPFAAISIAAPIHRIQASRNLFVRDLKAVASAVSKWLKSFGELHSGTAS